MTIQKSGEDFKNLLNTANEIPEVKEYLMSFSIIIGDLVLARRLQLSWSQMELAQKAGTTQARISELEAGKPGMKMETVDKVFKALGLANIQPTFINREDAPASFVDLIVTR